MAGNITVLEFCSNVEHQKMFTDNHLAIAIFNFFIAAGSVILNLGFAIVLCKSKFLETPSNSLLLSLTFVDLLTGAIAQTSFAIENFLFSRCIFYKALDVFVAVVGHLLGAMSFTTVILVSLDRYVAILHPFFYELQVTRYRLVIVQFMIWLLPMPILLFSVLHQNQLSLYYTILSFTIAGWLLGVYFYSKILAVARSIIKSEKKIKHAVVASASTLPSSRNSRGCPHTVRSQTKAKIRHGMEQESRRGITTVICIMSALLATFTPIAAFSIYMVTRKDLGENYFEQIILHWVQSLSLMNSLLNPLIYCFRITDVRKELFRITGISRSTIFRTSS